jgi:ADP-ribosylglycohydrolase
MLCTVESLVTAEFDLEDMGRRFVAWFHDFKWTPHGEAFDIGMATADALLRIEQGSPAASAGGRGEYDNGNGSLMRIIPVALRFAGEPADVLLDRVRRASAVTHGHPRSQMACEFHALLVRQLLNGIPPDGAWGRAQDDFRSTHASSPEFGHFRRFLECPLDQLNEGRIVSTGYVLHTLHAAVWALLTTDNYRDCVLRAVNLGGDTDTTGCVAGGLAGVCYGLENVPEEWRNQIARRDDLGHLFDQFDSIVSTSR